jgi:predicted RNase H-like HicB family nuclease
MTMRYPIAIEPGTDTAAYGVVIPDLPGAFSAGDTLDEAMAGAVESAAAWFDATLDAGGVVPSPSSLESVSNNPDYHGWIFAVITVDPALLDGSVNITLLSR